MTTTWQCNVCGYVHNGEDAPGFCPVCGAEGSYFSPLEIKRSPPSPSAAEHWQCSICEHIADGSAPPDTCPICGAAAALFHPHLTKTAPAANADVQKVVILGAGIAGMTAAEEARRQAPEVDIVLISKEMSLPYYRLNLTRYLAGEVSEGDLFIHHQSWFEQQQINYLAGEARSINRQTSVVVLGDGREINYDRLVLANGAHPFIPPIAGANRDGVMVMRSLEHARKLIAALKPGCRAICVGGGLLGLECARAMQRRGAEVTVLEGFDWLLPRQLPPAAAKLLKGHLTDRQMSIECGVKIKEFTGDEAVRGVLLEDGREIAADLVVLAAGVRPNSHLARQCGLKVRQGVVVDDQLYTSDDKILAAGDVTEHQGIVYGIWPASYAQGVVAGINAVGGAAEFSAIPMTNRIKVLDVELFSIGQIQASDASTILYEVEKDGNYRGIICRDGKVIGAVLYGEMELTALLQEAVEEEQHIAELGPLLEAFPKLAADYA